MNASERLNNMTETCGLVYIMVVIADLNRVSGVVEMEIS